MHVAAILREKGRAVETAGVKATVMDVAARLSALRIGAIVVTNDDGSIAGIVSERDIIRGVGREGASVLDWPVADIMTRSVMTCVESDTVGTLMATMTTHRFRHLPVLDQGRLSGIISIGDVVKHRVAEAELEATMMRDYITAS